MANASTVQHPSQRGRYCLPYGFPQSPLIASIALSKSALGSALDAIAGHNDLRISVYVDDIILSGPSDQSLLTLLPTIEAAASRSRFNLSREKQEGPASCVAAFNINVSGDSLELDEKRHGSLQSDYHTTENQAKKAGITSYVRSVNRAQADALIEQLRPGAVDSVDSLAAS